MKNGGESFEDLPPLETQNGHPQTVKGRPRIPFTCICLWLLRNPLIKSQNFCREIHSIFRRLKWPSSCQVELTGTC